MVRGHCTDPTSTCQVHTVEAYLAKQLKAVFEPTFGYCCIFKWFILAHLSSLFTRLLIFKHRHECYINANVNVWIYSWSCCTVYNDNRDIQFNWPARFISNNVFNGNNVLQPIWGKHEKRLLLYSDIKTASVNIVCVHCKFQLLNVE